MIKVVAKCSVKPDGIEEFKKITSKLLDETRKEDGCITYELFQDNENENILIFVETWENMDKLNAHIETSHVKEALPQMEKTYEKDMELHFMKLVK